MSLPLARRRPVTALAPCRRPRPGRPARRAPDWDLGGSRVTSLWNGSLTTAGGRATVRDAAFNGSLRPGATTSFGFTADGTAGTPAPHCAGS
ncbi:cellulose binding domain-containing protein [Streptomyces sp. NPDC052727]|uniref:cellulose binding domain-containing protein n=1 Tax=Streptomyces sp. NPDC052727 TaxID=3154854 RepID=UPI003447432C